MRPVSKPGLNLPVPDAPSLAHSERTAAFIRRQMESAGGSLGFAEFMHLALYAPGFGYYSAGPAKFGRAGDFVTAPEISPLFGRVLARQCAGILAETPHVLELGAGSGALAAELLQSFAAHGVEVASYSILEVSPDLRQRQEQLLREKAPQHVGKVEWLSGLPAAFAGVVIANEVADALPVERFEKEQGRVLQHRVAAGEHGFSWRREHAPPFLETAVRNIEESLGSSMPDGYVSEVSAGLPAWVGDLAQSLERGFVFLFDYGVTRREYYADDRHGGWLRCHFRHHVHDDPFIYPGIQDLSAWVDFTAVAEGAVAGGLEVAGFVSQAQFLLQGGLDAELAEFAGLPIDAQLDLSRQVRILTLPNEMGEHFKCIGLSRSMDVVPACFGAYDRSHTL